MRIQEKAHNEAYKKVLIDGKILFPATVMGTEHWQSTTSWESSYLHQIDIPAVGFQNEVHNAAGKRILLVYQQITKAYGYSYTISEVKSTDTMVSFIVDPSSLALHLSDTMMLG